jgi:hypothetical protein
MAGATWIRECKEVLAHRLPPYCEECGFAVTELVITALFSTGNSKTRDFGLAHIAIIPMHVKNQEPGGTSDLHTEQSWRPRHAMERNEY